MENRIVLELPNGYKLVAEPNAYPEYANEIFIGVCTPDNTWVQDLAIVRNAFDYDDNDKVVWKDGEFEVCVYADKHRDDYTYKFPIGICNDDN